MNNTREYALEHIGSLVDIKKAKNIEKSILNFTVDYCNKNAIDSNWENITFVHVYKCKFYEIATNLRENNDLIEKLNSKEIASKDICNIDIYSTCNQESDLPEQEEIADGVFECRKCGSKKTSYYSLQTRSADEPMTNFITCIQCKNRWKM